ncbi:Uncharacterized protein, contains caspase domain [Bradyrhizobium shewense]|uniref:Uncharacterized protein, contains caspase domain n=1 Tax=Bradyrhizobium shewense TaxID=1761772 RepID=A0A1C3XQF7_9BRAD|nr:caspase family protein [Bradyrhizobium shewense]SCB54498.1 Uncharacterized protein, contains caspase domain [Bradyrhizobium shewense]
MMKHIFRACSIALTALAFFVLATWLVCGPALAEKRVALVIGNSAYKNTLRLTNPVNDAALVGDMFKKAGFDAVDVKTDLNASEMRRMLREFAGRVRDADMAVIYYAGHGIELDGNNYLIPTDAMLETDGDVLDETVALDRALFAVEPAKRLRLVILDACRDNPFSKTMKRMVASRAIGRGLAKVEPTSPNTMIAFAAKAGSTASDGDSRNSPFATALVEHLPKPGLDLRKAFGFVRDDVLKNTGSRQEPYVYGSLGGDDVPLVPAKPVAVAGPQANPQDSVRRDYELALQAGLREAWEAFLQTYPDGFYANLARVQLKKIAAEEERTAATEKARLTEQEKVKLAAERAHKAELEKAAAAAKAAEDARIAAEKQKQIEQAKADAAERERKIAEAAAAKALAEKQKAAAEAAAKQAADKQATDAESKKVAALSPPPTSSAPAGDLPRSVQVELRRVGCMKAEPYSEWSETAQRSLTLFNKYAGTKFDVKLANVDVLDALRAKPGRICPLVCDRGFRADGDQCVKISCRAGYRINDDNECEKIERKPVSRQDSKSRDQERKSAETGAKPQATGQIICTVGTGCRPVRKGCRVEAQSGGVGQTEICN